MQMWLLKNNSSENIQSGIKKRALSKIYLLFFFLWVALVCMEIKHSSPLILVKLCCGAVFVLMGGTRCQVNFQVVPKEAFWQHSIELNITAMAVIS